MTGSPIRLNWEENVNSTKKIANELLKRSSACFQMNARHYIRRLRNIRYRINTWVPPGYLRLELNSIFYSNRPMMIKTFWGYLNRNYIFRRCISENFSLFWWMRQKKSINWIMMSL